MGHRDGGVHTCGVLAESIELHKVFRARGCVGCEWADGASDGAEGGPCEEGHVWIKPDDEGRAGTGRELDLRPTPLERLASICGWW